MWIKICANTCVEDALQAAELGADAVGFVFAPSKRQVTPQQVRLISAQLPPHVERVGVFPDLPPQQIAEAADAARLNTVQLHGGFHRERTHALRAALDPHVAIIQVVHWAVGDDQASAATALDSLTHIAELGPARVLVDAKTGGASGGTGVNFDWVRAVPVLHSQPSLHIILAGGLRPDNVAEAIRVLRPWGVDVASGVEREPGHKDFAKLKAFIENARGAC